MAVVKSKAPTGLAIKRNKNVYTLTWKKGDKDYADGQTCVFRCNTDKFANQTVSAGTTSKSVAVDYTKYYPHTSKMLTRVQFGIRGNRKQYTEKQKVSGKDADVTIDPTVSDWSYKEFAINKPQAPSVSATLSNTYSNVCTFSWSEKVDTASHTHFADCQYQSILVSESDVKDGSTLPWSVHNMDWITGTTGATGSINITEQTERLARASYTRWVRVRARGARGASDWRYMKHVYARPNQAKIKTAKVKQTNAGGYLCTVEWVVGAGLAHPIDKVTVQYALAVPMAGMVCPDGASWTDAIVTRDTAGIDKAAFSVDTTVGNDQCLFVRVNTEHDSNITYGAAKVATVGYLADPTDLSVSTSSDTYRATVTATNVSDVPDSYLLIRYLHEDYPYGLAVGIIPHGQTSATVQCPEWAEGDAVGFSVQAVVATYKTSVQGGVTKYTIKTYKMRSRNRLTYGGSIPVPPSNVELSMTDTAGTIQVSFDWTWQSARAAEISWSNHDDAWQSTDEPDTYTINNTNASVWNISGLEVGQTWYVRVRLVGGTEDAPTYGGYSDTVSIDLASEPITPVLSLSSGVITDGGTVTASWVYVSTDTTLQAEAHVAEVADTTQLSTEYVETADTEANPYKAYYVKDGNNYHVIDLGDYSASTDTTVAAGKQYYLRTGSGTASSPYVYTLVASPTGNPQTSGYYEFDGTYSSPSGYYEQNYRIIASTQTAQNVTISASEVGWATGEEHALAVRVVSASGRETGWSDPVSVMVAEPLVCEITQTSLTDVTEDSETVKYLTALPLTATITGAGAGGTTTLAIERAQAYHVTRPDETDLHGFEGETVALITQTGEAQITVGLDDLIGRLDDGAHYRLVASISDGLGQSASETIDFWVGWEHQAIIPDGEAVLDTEHIAMMLTPIAPDGAVTGDVCDIYRLSVDKPQLIYEGAEWGETYVDPYPTIGEYGGYRFVFRSKEGDYITGGGELAWIDADTDIDYPYNIFDFGTGRVELEYNVDVSNSWKKDFKETQYLGGSIQGDWNHAVSRSSSVGAVGITTEDQQTIEAVRRLAVYPGICHVRTKEGSSYPADVQVSESYAVGEGHKLAKFSLKITRVDSEGLDGMTLAEWEASHQEEEEE